MSNQDVVVTDFSMSAKQQALKNRFLSNAKTQKPNQAQPKPQSDPKMTNFLEEMQETMRQQTTGTLAGDLLKRQANIMQEQVDILRENQKNLAQVVSKASSSPNYDPRSLLAEMLAPLNKQIMEVKNYYEETKSTAREIASQVQSLKTALSRNSDSGNLKESVESGINRFASQKAKFQRKVQQAEGMVEDVIKNASDKLDINNCTQGINYLKEQITAIQKDTETVENELMKRFNRIMEQSQKIKHAPKSLIEDNYKSSYSQISERLGGVFDYEEFLDELQRVKDTKNQLANEFQRGKLTYPVAKEPKHQEVQKQPKEKPRKKPLQMHPPPPGGKRKFTTKPDTLKNIKSKPTYTAPVRIKPEPKPEPPKSVLTAVRKKPERIEQPKPQPEEPKLKPTEEPKPQPKEEPKLKPTEEPKLQPKEGPIDIPESPKPAPFQTKPGVTKGLQIREQDIRPPTPLVPEPQTRPQDLQQQTLDVVTNYVLANLLKANQQEIPQVPIEKAPGKWLGTEEINYLIKDQIQVDSDTIEKLGREVLSDMIQKIKEEEEYASDFEEESPVQTPTAKPSTPPQVKIDVQQRPSAPYHPQIEFGEQKPFEPIRIESNKVPQPKPQKGSLQSLLDPRILGSMSAAAVKHYVSALTESGHLAYEEPDSQAVPQVFSQSVPESEPQIPEGMKGFFESQIGKELLEIVQKEGGSSQEIMEKWASRFIPREPKEYSQLSISEPPEVKHAKTEAGVFGVLPKVQTYNIEEEEKKIQEEEAMPRQLFEVPLFQPPSKLTSSPGAAAFLLSDTESFASTESVGQEIFAVDNPEFLDGFVDFIRKAKNLEEGQVPGNTDLSEGEVRAEEQYSSGEFPESFPSPFGFQNPRLRISATDLFSDDTFEESLGSNPSEIFRS